MPTIVRVKGYRFFFFSREGHEPAHVHVAQAERYAKFWLKPVRLAESIGFRSHEVSELRAIVGEYEVLFEEKWHEYFAGQA